ncbi:hypothetical protein WDW89_24330 [Deltaproteobacteria bacterium TL4]
MKIKGFVLVFFVLFLSGTPWLWAQNQKLDLQHHTFGLEFRMDLVIETSENEKILEDAEEKITETLKLDSSLKFRISRARMNFKGNVDPKTTYRVRLQFNKSFDAKDRIDNTGEALDLWYITREIVSFLPEFRVGKIEVLAGALESQFYSEMDLYQSSRTLPKLTYYEVGGEMTFEFVEQQITLQMVNSPLGRDNQSSASVNMTIRGNLIDERIKSLIVFGFFPSAESTLAIDNGTNSITEVKEEYAEQHAAIGLRTNIKVHEAANLRVELEYVQWVRPEFNISRSFGGSEPTVLTNNEHKIQSNILGLRYETPYLHTILRFVGDTEKQDGVPGEQIGIDEIETQYYGGIEYYPEGKINTFRFHAILGSKILKPKDSVETKSTTANVGVSAQF